MTAVRSYDQKPSDCVETSAKHQAIDAANDDITVWDDFTIVDEVDNTLTDESKKSVIVSYTKKALTRDNSVVPHTSSVVPITWNTTGSGAAHFQQETADIATTLKVSTHSIHSKDCDRDEFKYSEHRDIYPTVTSVTNTFESKDQKLRVSEKGRMSSSKRGM